MLVLGQNSDKNTEESKSSTASNNQPPEPTAKLLTQTHSITKPLTEPNTTEEPSYSTEEPIYSNRSLLRSTKSVSDITRGPEDYERRKPIPAPRKSLIVKNEDSKSTSSELDALALSVDADEFSPKLFLASFLHKQENDAKRKRYSDACIQYDSPVFHIPPPPTTPPLKPVKHPPPAATTVASADEKQRKRKSELLKSSPYPQLYNLMVSSADPPSLNATWSPGALTNTLSRSTKSLPDTSGVGGPTDASTQCDLKLSNSNTKLTTNGNKSRPKSPPPYSNLVLQQSADTSKSMFDLSSFSSTSRWVENQNGYKADRIQYHRGTFRLMVVKTRCATLPFCLSFGFIFLISCEF